MQQPTLSWKLHSFLKLTYKQLYDEVTTSKYNPAAPVRHQPNL